MHDPIWENYILSYKEEQEKSIRRNAGFVNYSHGIRNAFREIFKNNYKNK